MIGWPTCLSIGYLLALCLWTHWDWQESSTNGSRRLGRPITKDSKLVTWFKGVALQGGPKGAVLFFRLVNFKIKLTPTVFSKLPTLALSHDSVFYCLVCDWVWLGASWLCRGVTACMILPAAHISVCWPGRLHLHRGLYSLYTTKCYNPNQ